MQVGLISYQKTNSSNSLAVAPEISAPGDDPGAVVGPVKPMRIALLGYRSQP